VPHYRAGLGVSLLLSLSVFARVNFVSPGPSIRTASGTEAKFTEILYLSFAALTTIGSSGEESLTPMVRQLAVVEAAMGQQYLAVLISRLVGFSTSGDAKST